MCGFFVIKKKNNNFKLDKKLFLKSCDLINHRWPDDKQNFFSNNLSIGFRRLSIVDLTANGRQPMIDEKKGMVLVFNGEIYNARKLKKYFKNHEFKGNSDTEVLFKLYQKYGTSCLKMIKGMFSFVVYDSKENSIFLARDQFGIKPLYYFEEKNYLLISSEIKPIINYLTKSEIDYKTLAEFFLLGKQDHNNTTFFKNVKSIEPAHYYKFKGQSIYKKKYWSIFQRQPIKLDEKKSIAHLSNLLYETIDDYLVSDRKVSTFLSGGIDSTTLTSLISKKVDYNLKTFTYDFKDNYNYGEAFKVKNNSKLIKVSNENFFLDTKFVLKNFDNMCKILESPFTSIRQFGVYGLYKLVKQKGYKVIIEGAGSDEILGGYFSNYLPYLLDKHKKLNNVINELISIGKKSSKKVETFILNMLMTLTNQGGSTTDATPFIDINFFNKDFLDINVNEEFYSQKKINYKNFNKMNYLQKSQIYEIQDIRLPRNLKYTDRLSMISGVETRLPFLDVAIAKFCFNLNNEMKLKDNTNRWIMKKIMSKHNKKINFPKNKNFIVDPQKKWFQNELKEFLIDNFSSKEFDELGIFNQKYILKKFNSFIKEEIPETSFQYIQVLSAFRFLKKFK